MTINDMIGFIKAEGQRVPHLAQLFASGALNNPEWAEWLRASDDPIENRLIHLEMAISSALSDPPDQQPTNDLERRMARADKVRKQLKVLASSLQALEQEEGFTWSLVRSRHVDAACSRMAERFPSSAWRRSIPPAPRLTPGWEEGVRASVEALPALLDVMTEAVGEWGKSGGWPVRANKGERARRTYFVKSLCYQFRLRYSQPLHGLIASLAQVFFPSMGDLTAKVVQKIEKGA